MDACEDRAEDLLARLGRLAYNLRWSWEPPAARVFASLAPETWATTHNPVAVLRAVSGRDRAALRACADAIDAAAWDLARYLSAPLGPLAGAGPVAYLSAEFALADCLPIYAGGLGVLAADYLKAASDQGLPTLGVGLLYHHGYFRQELDPGGYQQERYDPLRPQDLPLRPVRLPGRAPLRIAIPFPSRTVLARVWRAEVGRVAVYLLDTDLPDNRDDDRWITGHLYGGDLDTRLRQEIVLGIGGARLVRALHRLGEQPAPAVFHLNEGHSAFVILELARERLVCGGAGTAAEAIDQVARHVVFTTHTPVAAGHDVFPAELVESYLGDYRTHLGLSPHGLLDLGRARPGLPPESFSMTVLALRGAARRNGVSQLHAAISAQTWQAVGVGTRNAPPQVAMAGVTNGVHGPTWAGPEMLDLFDRWLGPGWRTRARDPATWAPLAGVPLDELWAARCAQRARLLRHARLAVDDPTCVMVLGFARRAAAYKRAGLLFQDLARLERVLFGDPQRPVVVLLAGKAHPRDDAAKRLVQRLVQTSRQEPFTGRVAFLEDYDLELARLLVQGSDVWLNTPRRPFEASGTSGMKAVLNGALHVSELDGWWDEAYRPELGWALGDGRLRPAADDALDGLDRLEGQQLLDLLEHEVRPLFFARDARGLPRAWLARVVRSITALSPAYSAERMVVEYTERLYAPRERGPGQHPQTLDGRFARDNLPIGG